MGRVTRAADLGHDLASQTKQIKALQKAPYLQMPLAASGISFPTRAVGTLYAPNPSRPTLVLCTILLIATAGVTSYAQVYVSQPSSGVAFPKIVNGSTATIEMQIPVTFLVDPGASYSIIQESGMVLIASTTEYTL